MEQPDFKLIAAQLRQPSGSAGLEIAERMSISNGNMIRTCIDHLTLKPDDAVLEIGPGGGLHLPYLMKKQTGLKYTGADISETMVALATENTMVMIKEGLSVSFMQAMAKDGFATLPFTDNAFENIFTVNTLYFWDDAPAQAKEILRVLKPGGTLAVCFATESFMKMLPFTQYGFNLYTVEKASSLFKQAGFIQTVTYTKKETVMSVTGEALDREFIVMTAGKGSN